MIIMKDKNNNLIDAVVIMAAMAKKKVPQDFESIQDSFFSKAMRKIVENMKPFSVFDNALKKIYGKDFFADTETGDFDGDEDFLSLNNAILLEDIERLHRNLGRKISKMPFYVNGEPVKVKNIDIFGREVKLLNFDKDLEPDDTDDFFIDEKKWR